MNLDVFEFPAGRKPGVKVDKRAMDRARPVTEVIEVIPEQFWDELAASQWHAAKDLCYRYTLDQDGIGSCAAESACGTKAACDTRQGLPMVLYNPLGTYYTTSGGSDRGSVIGENLELIVSQGCFPEEVWPRSKGFRAEPSKEAKEIAGFFRLREFFTVTDTASLVSALLQGYNVHAGYSGHAISFSRYMGKGVLRFKNSWGQWGEDGFGTLSVSKVYYPYGAYAYKDVVPFTNAKGEWGRVEADGSWTPCPWKPKYDQASLAKSVMMYCESVTLAKLNGLRPSDTTIRYSDYMDAYCDLA